MRLLAVGALLTTVALGLYGDSLGGWFLADDFVFVERSYLWWNQQPWWFLQMFVVPPEHSEPGGFHRPLSMLIWGLDYLAWGIHPVGYRVTNLLVHVGCGLLIFRLAWRWSGGRQDISWLAALLFLVCPLHTESVAWIAARDETLAVLFFLGVLNLVPVTRASGMTFGIVLTLCAFWSKESALMLPPLVTLYHLLVAAAGRPLMDRLRQAIAGSLWIWIVTACYLAGRYWVLGKFGGTYGGYEPPDYLTLDYIGSRLTYWVLLFSPLEGETFPAWLRWTVGLGTLALVTSSFATRSLRPGIVLLVVCWTLLAPMPYLWENVDPHDLRQTRHLYACYAPFSILLAIGTTHVARLLPGSQAIRCLFFGTLLVLVSCATWLTKQAHLRAAELSWTITEEIHGVMELEGARPKDEQPDRLVLQNLPPDYGGAHLGINMVSMSRPPFHERASFEVEVLDRGFFPLFVVSYLEDARDQDRRVVRYRWRPEGERFELKPTFQDSAILRGTLEKTADGFRLRRHAIRLTAAGAAVDVASRMDALAGDDVEIVGRLLPAEPGMSGRSIGVTALRRVQRILEVPGSVVRGGELVVRVHGRPGSYYLLFPPGPAGFLPLHEFGTLLVDTNVEAFTKGRVPKSGVAEHRILLPAEAAPDETPKGRMFYYQGLITCQDEDDPRVFVLTACRGFLVRPRRR